MLYRLYFGKFIKIKKLLSTSYFHVLKGGGIEFSHFLLQVDSCHIHFYSLCCAWRNQGDIIHTTWHHFDVYSKDKVMSISDQNISWDGLLVLLCEFKSPQLIHPLLNFFFLLHFHYFLFSQSIPMVFTSHDRSISFLCRMSNSEGVSE